MNPLQEKKTTKKVVKTLNKELKDSRKVAIMSAAKPVRQTVKKVDKAVRSRAAPKMTHLRKWAQSLSAPFDNPGSICPVSFNPAPSLSNTTARMTVTNLNEVVGANSTVQHVIFPGHGTLMPNVQGLSAIGGAIGSEMDPVAFHARGDYTAVAGGGLGGNRSCVGPVGYVFGADTYVPFCVTATALASGACSNVPGSFPLRWDTSLPYTSSPGGGSSHLRWQLVSCAIRIFNTTPALSRGGNVVSVQFMNNGGIVQSTGANASTQNQLEFNPSFRIHGDCTDGIEVSWIPRTQDLAYWHNVKGTDTNGNFNADTMAGAGFAIFMNNPTGSPQTYAFQYVFNFMIAGNLVQAVSTESSVEQSLKPPVEQTIIHMQNNTATAKPAPAFAEAAAMGDTGQTMSEKISSLKDRAYRFSQDTFFSLGAGAASALLNHQSYGHARYGSILGPRV